jgi:predicted flap endonuclease-1-like 5' DNA nuclease
MPPKNKKKNKGTKFVVAGEEVLNMSGVGKAITNNLNESGILSAGKQLKETDSFIFTATESEIQRVTTEGDDHNSSKLSGLNSARGEGA